MTAHAKYAPSSMHRIRICPASAAMEALYPDEDTVEKREGEAMHWAGAWMVENAGWCDMLQPGYMTDNGVVLNVEMIDAARTWANHLLNRGQIGSVEQTITEPALHKDNWGTPDHWWYDVTTMTLYVDDLKSGHRWVNVVWNDQLINYSALILRHLGLFGDDRVRIVFTLVLPRCYVGEGPIQTWETTLGDIKPRMNEMSRAMLLADDPNTPCNASEVEACMDCRARHDCVANLEATSVAVSITSQPVPLRMSPAAQSKQLRILRDAEERIKSTREGMEQSIMQTIRRQRSVPYFALEHRPGRTVFADNAVDMGLIEAAKLFGVDVVKKEKALITPKQAIDAGMPVDMVKLFSKTNTGAVGLVEDDGSSAERIFKGATQHG